jgi:hypothetical protein
MPDVRHEPPASALARGATKTSDIEGVRREFRKAEQWTARRLEEAATRRDREAAQRAAQARAAVRAS